MYSLKYKVTTSTCDSEGNLKMYSALQMMQDCSEMWLESEPEVKAYFACENMTQLLASRQVEVLRVPSFKEELTVSTSVYEVKAMFGYRNTFIYDADGRPVQHLQYLPFGQSFVNQHTTGYQERYTFTGKERDEETGYGYLPQQVRQAYHGARYMDYELMTMWLSVDPMADKYPWISPYAYCAWNPVKLVDPNGCMIDDYFSFDGRYLGSDNAETHNVLIIRESTWEYLGRDEDGIVEHIDGNHASCSFSEASKHGMSLDAQLAVYQHYNITGFEVHALPKEREDSKIGGMQTAVDYVAGKTTITLNVKLFGNMNTQLCDNSCNIINSYVHENDHIAKAKEWGYQKYRTYKEEMLSSLETSAIAVQKEHPSWQCTSEKYKIRIEAYNESFH